MFDAKSYTCPRCGIGYDDPGRSVSWEAIPRVELAQLKARVAELEKTVTQCDAHIAGLKDCLADAKAALRVVHEKSVATLMKERVK